MPGDSMTTYNVGKLEVFSWKLISCRIAPSHRCGCITNRLGVTIPFIE